MRHRAVDEAGYEDGPSGDSGDPDALTPLDSLETARATRIRVGVGAGVVILISAMAVAVVVSAVASQGTSAEVASRQPTSSPTASGGDHMGGAPSSGDVLVHVLGAVKRPGLVSLGAGARVVDAVAAAGGLADDAEPAGINLARPVTDGEQLVVPHVGEVVEQPPAATGAGPNGSAEGSAVVNLNSATLEQLETLQGIGPALASRILDWREANGRFGEVADLMNVRGIGQKVFDGLKDRITV